MENFLKFDSETSSKKEALIWLGELAIIHTTGKETDGR